MHLRQQGGRWSIFSVLSDLWMKFIKRVLHPLSSLLSLPGSFWISQFWDTYDFPRMLDGALRPSQKAGDPQAQGLKLSAGTHTYTLSHWEAKAGGSPQI